MGERDGTADTEDDAVEESDEKPDDLEDEDLFLEVHESEEGETDLEPASQSPDELATRREETARAIPVDSRQGRSRKRSDRLLETGVESFDQRLGGGFVPGSIILVEGDPRSKSGILTQNLLVDRRPVHYFTGAVSKEVVDRRLDKLKLIPEDERRIHDSPGMEIGDLIDRLADLDLQTPSTVVIDPVTGYEDDVSRDEYIRLIRTLRHSIKDSSVGLIHCPTPQSEPDHRWVSTSLSDTVLEVRHNPDRSSPNILLVNRVHPDQPYPAEHREFDVTGDLELTIEYDESITTPTR